MAYTLANAITEVRYLINEDTPDYWSDTQITSWIQQGTLDWCEKSLLYMAEDTITLATGQTKYTTSVSSNISSALRTLHATYNGTALQRISYEQLHKHNARSLGGVSTPFYYFDHFIGTALGVFIGPVPTATENATTVSVTFAMKTTDITAIPHHYQPTIFLYAAHKAKFRERQYQESFLYYQQYINNIGFSRGDSLSRGEQPIDGFRIK